LTATNTYLIFEFLQFRRKTLGPQAGVGRRPR
jgi:hypothetical protein